MATIVEPQVRAWTRHDYHTMAQAGLFKQQRVELIEGSVIEMSPMGSVHATTVALAGYALEAAFGAGYFVRWQMPLALGEFSEPEPDIAVIAGAIRDYTLVHPATAALLVEVADTSLSYDRTDKANLYAKAQIKDYWIINLVDQQLEVYRDPQPNPTARYQHAYTTHQVLTKIDQVAPLAQPHAIVAVTDLLP